MIKGIYKELQALKDVLTTHNFSKGKVIQVGFLLDGDELIVETYFEVKVLNQSDILKSYSRVDLKYLSQYSDEKLLKHIVTDILVNLEESQLDKEKRH